MQSKIPSKRPLPIIRVFVSSTFSDLKHERNSLHTQVWPELERYCQQRGFTFQAIDLRWGVPAEASLDHRTMHICFEELRRSQQTSPEPNFLILLGNRYGWRPLPEVISVEEFEKLKDTAEQIQSDPTDHAKRLTEKQVGLLKKAVGILQDWYLLDENAKPFGEKTPIGEYILRSRKPLLNGVDYGRQTDATGILRDTPAWVDVQFVLWSTVNRMFPRADLARRFQALDETSPGTVPSIIRFQASATEQEIWQGALKVENADRHVIAAIREIDDLNAFPNRPRRGDFIDQKDDGTPDDDARQALADLKAEIECRLSRLPIIRSTCEWAIDQDNIPTGDITTFHLDDFCREILDRLKSIFIEQINAYWGCDLSADDATLAQVRGSQQELDLERADHLRFAGERAPEKTFVGREFELQRIRDYLGSKTNQPFVVHAHRWVGCRQWNRADWFESRTGGPGSHHDGPASGVRCDRFVGDRGHPRPRWTDTRCRSIRVGFLSVRATAGASGIFRAKFHRASTPGRGRSRIRDRNGGLTGSATERRDALPFNFQKFECRPAIS